MAKTRAVHAYKEEALDLEAKIIEAISSRGPRNVSEISRLTDAPVETIRYKIKRQFKNLGFRIHAEVDYGKLGLTMHWATMRFSEEYLASASHILGVLNNMGYLVYYGKIVPQGYYAGLFALPEGAGAEYPKFLRFMKESGVLDDFSFVESVLTKHHSMNPRYFNFQRGRWEMDWTRVELERPPKEDEKKARAEINVDNLDLLLVKELQIDALQHVVGVARKLKIHPKTLEYHYRAHVEGRALIPKYIVRWMNDIDSTLSHSQTLARLTVNDLDATGLLGVRQVMRKIPFLWAEDVLKNGAYVAWLWIPLEETIATFDYLHRHLPGQGGNMEVGFVKVWDSCLYTVPYQMFTKGWNFDVGQMQSRFRKAIAQKTSKQKSGSDLVRAASTNWI